MSKNYVVRLFEPQEDWPLSSIEQFRRQRQIQAMWIGIIAFVLPVFLYLGNRSSDCFRDTISHSYYLPVLGDVFVAATCAVGLLLMFYRGQSWGERMLAIIGGACAVVVALLPTNGSGCDDAIAVSRIFHLDPSDLLVSSAYPIDAWQGTVHLWAAILLFIALAIFNLFVFTATDETNPQQMVPHNRNKEIRNAIYRFCGRAMVANLLILVAGFGFSNCDAFDHEVGISAVQIVCREDPWFSSNVWDEYNLTFYFEWLGLALFGVAWLVKGRCGGFLLLDETPDKRMSRPWWWPGAG